MGVPAIAIEMASMSNGGSAMESNPLQVGVPTNKIRSSFDQAVGLAVVDDFAKNNPPPPTPVPSLPNRPAAFSFGFNQALASVPTLQAGRDRSSRRKVQKKKRSLPMPTSPVTTTAHGSFFSESQDDEQEKQEMVVVATQFGAGKVLHYVRNGTCQVIELPWRLAGGAHAILYRPVTA